MKEDKPLGLGLVGCSSALLYVYGPHTFRALTGGKLVAVMDVKEDRAEAGCKKLGAKRWYTNYEKLLEDEEVDAVILVSPGWCHEPQTVSAAKAGKHVLCEKPMARTVEECDRMIEACNTADVTLMIAHMKRFNIAFRKVYDLLREGAIGDVLAVRGQWDQPARWLGGDDGFRSDIRSLGGHWHDHGVHMSDLARWWIGSPPRRVLGVIDSFGEHMTMGEDFSIATIEYENGATSCHQTTTYTYRAWYETYEILGRTGTLLVHADRFTSTSFEPPNVYLFDHTEGDYNADRRDLTPHLGLDVDAELRRANQYLQELEHFCECVKTGKTPLISGRVGREGVEIIDATYLSHFRKAWVELPVTDTGELPAMFEQYQKEQRAKRGTL